MTNQMTIPDEAVQAAIKAADDYYDVNESVGEMAMKAALTSALPFLTGVKVKALEWHDLDGFSTAPSDLVRFSVIKIHNGKGDTSWRLERNGRFSSKYDTLEAAKSAAQADYEARILSAIEVDPSPRAQALEEAEGAIDELRLQAFRTNSDADRQAYFDAVSKWFQDRHYRRMDADRSLSSQPVEDGWLPIETCPPEHVLFFGVDRHGDKVAVEGFKAVNGTLCVGNKDLKPFTFSHWRHLPASPGASE